MNRELYFYRAAMCSHDTRNCRVKEVFWVYLPIIKSFCSQKRDSEGWWTVSFHFSNLLCCLLFNTIMWYFAVYHVLLSYTLHCFPILAWLVDDRRKLWNPSAHPEYPQHKNRGNHLKEGFEKFMTWQVYGICCFSWFSATMKRQYSTQRKKNMVGLAFLPNDRFN